jgi:hypothetical protein
MVIKMSKKEFKGGIAIWQNFQRKRYLCKKVQKEGWKEVTGLDW